jgi:hypothetical protein
MKTRLRTFFLLSAFLTYGAQADNVWDYASERAQRQPAPSPSPAKLPLQESHPPLRADAPAPVKKSVVKAKRVETTPAPSPVPVVKPQVPEPVKPAPVEVKTEQVPPVDAVNLGSWLKKVVDAIKGTPDEEQLRQDFIETKREKSHLAEQVQQTQEKMKNQQMMLQLVQRKLKAVQSPSLPQDPAQREVFAAGMATGYNLLELLNARKEMGVELPRETFMAGIQEVMTDGKRLPPDEFEKLLKGITDKVSTAEIKIAQQREQDDLHWKTAFTREQNAQQSADGIWYKVIYAGDKDIADNETITLALSRSTTKRIVIEDSDISHHDLSIIKNASPPLLKGILNTLHLHGEAEIAMPVAQDGTPSPDGPFYEIWNIRIADSVQNTDKT